MPNLFTHGPPHLQRGISESCPGNMYGGQPLAILSALVQTPCPLSLSFLTSCSFLLFPSKFKPSFKAKSRDFSWLPLGFFLWVPCHRSLYFFLHVCVCSIVSLSLCYT